MSIKSSKDIANFIIDKVRHSNYLSIDDIKKTVHNELKQWRKEIESDFNENLMLVKLRILENIFNYGKIDNRKLLKELKLLNKEAFDLALKNNLASTANRIKLVVRENKERKEKKNES